jgi:FkbM family methyltransferase
MRAVAGRLFNALPPGLARHASPHSPAARVLRPVVNKLLGHGELEVTIRSGPAAGLRLAIDPQAEKYYWTGTHEPHVLEAIDPTVEPGDVVWDVGGHIGYFALTAARRVAPAAVVTFEPQAENRARLARNARLNGMDEQIQISPFAVGAALGRALIHDRGTSTMWSLAGEGAGVEVEVLTLDAALDRYPVPRLVKIDAEGVELDVLRGGLGLLERWRPHILIEMMQRTQSEVDEARALAPGYEFSHLGANHWLLSPA